MKSLLNAYEIRVFLLKNENNSDILFQQFIGGSKLEESYRLDRQIAVFSFEI